MAPNGRRRKQPSSLECGSRCEAVGGFRPPPKPSVSLAEAERTTLMSTMASPHLPITILPPYSATTRIPTLTSRSARSWRRSTRSSRTRLDMLFVLQVEEKLKDKDVTVFKIADIFQDGRPATVHVHAVALLHMTRIAHVVTCHVAVSVLGARMWASMMSASASATVTFVTPLTHQLISLRTRATSLRQWCPRPQIRCIGCWSLHLMCVCVLQRPFLVSVVFVDFHSISTSPSEPRLGITAEARPALSSSPRVLLHCFAYSSRSDRF